jgi:RNA polymerase sigma-70 factor (ECF subfamily)
MPPANTPQTAEELALLTAWRAGDNQAGEALFECHFDAIYDFFASKLTVDVSDLVQRTFLGCVEAKERFRGEASFRTFLFAIARHELYGHFRAKHRGRALDFGVSSLEELAPGPSSLLHAGTERALLAAALRALPLELQLVLELRFWQGLTGPELALVLELPEGTVRSRLRRAIELLRTHLESTLSATPVGLVEATQALDAWSASLAG